MHLQTLWSTHAAINRWRDEHCWVVYLWSACFGYNEMSDSVCNTALLFLVMSAYIELTSQILFRVLCFKLKIYKTKQKTIWSYINFLTVWWFPYQWTLMVIIKVLSPQLWQCDTLVAAGKSSNILYSCALKANACSRTCMQTCTKTLEPIQLNTD